MAGGHNSILHSEDDDLIAYDDFSAIFQMILRILSIIRTSTYIHTYMYILFQIFEKYVDK